MKQRVSFLSSTQRRLAFFPLLPSILLFPSCTNNLTSNSATNQATNTVIATGTTGSSNAGIFTLSSVLLDTYNPSSTVDLIGDGSGTFGVLCGSSSAATPTCACTFNYTTSAGSTQQVDSPVSYVEADLIRCQYSGVIPSQVTSGVTAVNVSLHILPSDTYSTTFKFNFAGVGVTLDTSNPQSFSLIQRYQCRDTFFIPSIFDPNIYDPIQSEDYRLSYPIDFYAANFGNAVSQFIQNAGQNQSDTYGWQCPPIFNPSKYLQGTALTKFNSNFHINLTVYSKAPLSGSKLIYPPTRGTFDRSTFYLAKKASGLFNIPVNVVLAPNVTTSTSGQPGPIGYGASPVITSSNQEGCPDTSVIIPPHFHWVKVWLFRASLPQRNYAVPTGSSSLSSLGDILCNPGEFSTTQSASSLSLSACQLSNTVDSTSSTLSLTHLNGKTNGDLDDPSVLSPTKYLADRYVTNTNVCFRLNGSCGSSQGPQCVGADQWKPELPYGSSALNCSIDPLGLCSGNTNATQVKTAYSSGIGSASLDGSNPRYDFLFVVSPTSIMIRDMQNTSSSSPSLPYQPFRFYTDQDCLSLDPDIPTKAGDCSSDNAITTYGLKLHDVGTNGDPPANDPNRTGIYPICALQPDS